MNQVGAQRRKAVRGPLVMGSRPFYVWGQTCSELQHFEV